MAIENVMTMLASSFEQLREGLTCLRVTVVEDAPSEPLVALIDQRANTVDDAIGWAEEGLEAATIMLALAAPDWDTLRHHLAQAQRCFDRLHRSFTDDLVSYERVSELVSLGRRRGGEWQAWVKIVRQGLTQCQEAVYGLHGAFVSCWEEMAVRAPGVAIGVRAPDSSVERIATGASATVRSMSLANIERGRS